MKSRTKIKGFNTEHPKTNINNLNDSWKNKFYQINYSSNKTNEINKFSITAKDKNITSSFNNNSTNYYNDNEDFIIIKNMWQDLGVTEDYKFEFICSLKDLNENQKKELLGQEKKNLKRFRDYLLKLSKEITNREKNILTLKKFNEILDISVPEQKINESIINDIIKIIKFIRVNSVNSVHYIIKIREILSSNKTECGKFDIEKINKAYLYDKNYLIKMSDDLNFLKNSNIKQFIFFDNEQIDPFFSNCSDNNNNNDLNKIVIPIDNELMKGIKQAKYYITQDLFLKKIKDKKTNINSFANYESNKNLFKPKVLKGHNLGERNSKNRSFFINRTNSHLPKINNKKQNQDNNLIYDYKLIYRKQNSYSSNKNRTKNSNELNNLFASNYSSFNNTNIKKEDNIFIKPYNYKRKNKSQKVIKIKNETNNEISREEFIKALDDLEQHSKNKKKNEIVFENKKLNENRIENNNKNKKVINVRLNNNSPFNKNNKHKINK